MKTFTAQRISAVCYFSLLAGALVWPLGTAPVAAQAQALPLQALPLVASYQCEPDAAVPSRLADSGPLHMDGKLDNVTFVPGKQGQAIRLDGANSKAIFDGPAIQKLGANFTIAFWLRLERSPQDKSVHLLQKGDNAGFQLSLSAGRNLFYHGSWGGGWYDAGSWGGSVPPGQWVRVAWTFQKGEKGRIYLDGRPVGATDTPYAFYPENVPLQLGGADWAGAVDDLRIYAAALTPQQVSADRTAPTANVRPAVDSDFAPLLFPIRMALARFDLPLAFQPYDARRYQTARRIPGPDATDWPRLSLDGTVPLFRGDTADSIGEVPLLPEDQARNLFRQPGDHEIKPVHHWLRANAWLWNRKFVYSTDRTARTGSGDYEIWAFPIEIRGAGERDIQSVRLSLGGETVYERRENLRSLTLLLPANLNGAPYELWVNGRGPARFDVGLQPVAPGRPDDVPLPVNTTIPGSGPTITVRLAARPPFFPQQSEWDADQKLLANANERSKALAPRPLISPADGAPADGAPSRFEPANGTRRYLGVEVPRSPVAVFTASMRGGMSGGHLFNPFHIEGFKGTPEAYAAYLKINGYDWVFEDATPDLLESKDFILERWAAAMNAQGLRFGLNPDIPGNLGIVSNPNLAFQSSFLPEWGQPAYRDAQLVAQRFAQFPNFLGLLIGADNAGYVTYWDWAATIPDRPWGRAFEQFQRGHDFKVPLGPALRVSKPFERPGTQREFVDYIRRYDETFKRYGYFSRAVQEAAPGAVLASGSYGSNPGVGARGGWPWATIPGRPMLANLPVQMAYDWNEMSSSKPLHNVALLDRMRSYFPDKPTWALIDDFGLLFGREARQRAYALALTRGVDAIGTTFLAHPTGGDDARSGQMTDLGVKPRPRSQVIAEQQQLYHWIKRYGGVYHNTRLLPQIGVLYVHEQAISRPIVGGDNPDAAQLLRGSHEGKTNEALFLCAMAGFPAKIVTPEELKRGLPPSMKAVLLTGLNRFDNTWLWSDGLESSLQKFTAGGGKLLLDDESVVPAGVTASATGMRVAAYITQSNQDQSPLLFERNRDNAARLRDALKDLALPLARSQDATVWAVPHQTGDVQYVTVVNWASEPGKNASKVVRGQTGKLTWNTKRPIYDLTLGQSITPAQAQTVDLTTDAVRVYALPPAPLGAPAIAATRGADGFYRAMVSFAPAVAGVAVEVTLRKGDDTATVYGASGAAIALPLTSREAGTWTLSVKELLSGQNASATLKVAAAPATSAAVATSTAATASAPGTTRSRAVDDLALQLKAFAARREPLVIALTAQQADDAGMMALAQKLRAYFTAQGRRAEIRRIAANDVVLSLQPLRPQQRYPQWKTVDADLILLGSPNDNLLLLDQARGHLLSDNWRQSTNGKFRVVTTYSPFVGEKWALNLLAADAPGLTAAVRRVAGG